MHTRHEGFWDLIGLDGPKMTDQRWKAKYELEQSITNVAGSKNYEGRVKLVQPEHSL